MRRRFDVLHAPARWQVLRRNVGPLLSIVSRDVERAVISSRPDDTLLEWRFGDRVQRAVKLFSRNVASNRLTAHALTTIRMRRQVRRDSLPGHTLVTRA